MTPLFRRSPPAASTPSSPPLFPAPPVAKRLNRNALTVAAVIMGMTVLTVLVVLRPGNPSPRAPYGSSPQADANEAPPIPARPSFLDEPVHQPSSGARAAAVDSSDVPPSIEMHIPPAAHHGIRSEPVVADGSGEDVQEARGSVAASARARAYQAAVASSVLLSATARPAAARTESNDAGANVVGAASNEEASLLTLSDSILRNVARSSAAPATAASAPVPAAAEPLSNPRRAFLTEAATRHGATVIAALEPAGSPYTLRAGTVIPGLLVTGINSDLPGEIVGQVSRDVYDSRTQQLLLIPRGARLIGTYDNQVAGGQGRLLVAWTRLILPDGRSMQLPGLALADPQGQTGTTGRVTNHWGRVFGHALLLSAIGAGVQLSQPRQSTVLASPSAGQVAAGAVGQELSSVALEILRRGMDVAPTITIPQGQPFNVFLNGDLVFDAAYTDHRPPSAP